MLRVVDVLAEIARESDVTPDRKQPYCSCPHPLELLYLFFSKFALGATPIRGSENPPTDSAAYQRCYEYGQFGLGDQLFAVEG